MTAPAAPATPADTTAAAAATIAADVVNPLLRNAADLKEKHDKLQKQYKESVKAYVREAFNSARAYREDPNKRLTLASTILAVDAEHKTTNQLKAIESVLGYVPEDNDTRLQHFDVIQLIHELVKTSVTSELSKLQEFAVSLLKQSISVLMDVDDELDFEKINDINKFILEVNIWLRTGATISMPNVSDTEDDHLKYRILSQYNSYFTQGSISDGRPYKLLHTLQSMTLEQNMTSQQSMTSDSSDAKKTLTEWFDELKRVLTEFTMAKLVCSGSSQLTVFDTVMDTQSRELCHNTAELYERVMSMAEQRSQSSVESGANESSVSLRSAQYNDPHHESNQSMLKLVSTDESSKDNELMVKVVQHGMRHQSTTSNEKYSDQVLVNINTGLDENKVQRAQCVEALKAKIDQLETQERVGQQDITTLGKKIDRLERIDDIDRLKAEAGEILGVNLSGSVSLLSDVTTISELRDKLTIINQHENRSQYFSMSHGGQSNPLLQQMRAVVMIAKALARVEPGDTAQLQVRDAVFLDNERRDFEKARRGNEGWITSTKNWFSSWFRTPQSSRFSDEASPLVETIKIQYQSAIRERAHILRSETSGLVGFFTRAWKFITRSFRHESRRNESGVVGIQLVEEDTLRSLKQRRSGEELDIKNRKPRLKALKEKKSSLDSCGSFTDISRDTVINAVSLVIKEQQQREREQQRRELEQQQRRELEQKQRRELEQKRQKIYVQVAQKVRQLKVGVGVVEDMFNDPDESALQSSLEDFESESSFFCQLKRDNNTLKTDIENLKLAQPEIAEMISTENEEVKDIESKLNKFELELHNIKRQKQHQACRQRFNELREQLTQPGASSIDCLEGLKELQERIESYLTETQPQFAAVSTPATSKLALQYSNLLDDIKKKQHQACRQRFNEFREKLNQPDVKDSISGLVRLLNEITLFSETNEGILQIACPVSVCRHGFFRDAERSTAYNLTSTDGGVRDGFKIHDPSPSDNLKSQFDGLLREIKQKRDELVPPPARALSANSHRLLVVSSASRTCAFNQKQQGYVPVLSKAASSKYPEEREGFIKEGGVERGGVIKIDQKQVLHQLLCKL